jgi:4-amino-4-deoxychorismate lyase
MPVPTHLVDGLPSDVIAVTNRGLAYGDGLFETIRFHGSEPVLWERHWQRLLRGCEKLGLSLPVDDEANLLQQCRWLVEQNDLSQAVLKLILVRGGISRGYRSEDSAGLRKVVSISTLPEYTPRKYLSGVKALLCKTRLSVNPHLAGIKHLNRLEQVLASREWSDSAYSEGIMMDTSDHVIEGIKSNVFFVKDEYLITPGVNGSGVAGVMREYLIHCSQELGLRVAECEVMLQDLPGFQEAFICNSVFGIWPIMSLEVSKDDILHWIPGEVTRSLQQSIADKLDL